MKIFSPGFSSFAIIDIRKKYGEPLQYQKFTTSETPDFEQKISEAKKNNFEIRYQYNGIKNDEGGAVPAKTIVTYVPPNYVQPFHTHNNTYEVTIVEEGEVSYIESEELDSEDFEKIKELAKNMKAGDMVFDNGGLRHTIANFSDKYAKLLTVQTPKPYTEEFLPDWKN